MSRKDVFGQVQPSRAVQMLAAATPAAGPSAGSVRRFSAAIDEMQEKAARVDALEQAIADKDRAIEAARREGERVVEIDPALIDPSPIRDRMAADPADDESLRASIEETGQQIPVLLRPSTQEGRFVTVFGHRRIAAARALGRQVKAIVAEMSDEDAFVRQGVENAERRDLSFIERAMFARRLVDKGLSMKAIAASLGTARPNIVAMLTIVNGLPSEIVEAIGRAPTVGARRWAALQNAVANIDADVWRNVIAAPGFVELDAEGRVASIIAKMSVAPSHSRQPDLCDEKGQSVASIQRGRRGSVTLKVMGGDASFRPDKAVFGDWLARRLGDLHAAWRRGE